ncbi:hypothetical protein EU527_17725 [Candidatus Thorarchaeota archaeon]|nr:MAG: hypothetical protein EU527_17725 [Candidatus Thorarchaeota archaeon]
MTIRHAIEYMDIHRDLRAYAEVLQFFERLEQIIEVKAYCNGSNLGGRWVFQIYNEEFINELSSVINRTIITSDSSSPILEVMSGDGKLTEFLQPTIKRKIIATDAKDGRYSIAYPKWVETLDALESIERYRPSFIIMSWEPYLSMTGIDIVEKGIPTAWIGNPEMCGHPELLEVEHTRLRSPYALSRHDSFIRREFKTDVFLFNCSEERVSKAG